MYENDGVPLLGCVIGPRKNKLLVLNQRGREIELPADRLHKLPGSVPSTISTSSARATYLDQLVTTAEANPPNLAELWETIHTEGGEFTTTNLSELLYGSDSLEHHLSTRLALLKDKIYFRRDRLSFAARAPEHVIELTKAEEARLRRIRSRESLLSWIRQTSSGKQASLPSEAHEHLLAIESIAVGREDLEQTRLRETSELIDLCANILKLDTRAHHANLAYKILERCGHFSPRTNPIQVREQFPGPYSAEALEQAKQPQAAFEVKLSPLFRDLTAVECFTIDDPSTLDMDDALSIQELSGLTRVGVHIANVAAVIETGSPLDLCAAQRATSIYLPETTYNMFPEEIATNVASLLPQKSRYAVSVMADFDSDGRLLHFELCESVVKSARRLSYDQVDSMLAQGDHDLNKLAEVAAGLESARLDAGANQVQKRDVVPVVDQDGKVSLVEYDESSAARKLVGEMMILFNRLIAEYAHQHEIPFVYRSQEPPEEESQAHAPTGPALDFQQRFRLKRSVVSYQPGFHSGLGLNVYSQVSSPIRRYLDLVLLRQIISALRSEPPALNQDQLKEIVEPLDNRLATAQTISRGGKRYWMIRYLEQLDRSQREMRGTLVRHDNRVSLLELDSCGFTVLIKVPSGVQLGDRLVVRLLHADALSDHMKFEFIRSENASDALSATST